MAFELRVPTEAEFPDLVQCMWTAYEYRMEHFTRIFHPLNSTGEYNRPAAIAESVQRFWSGHLARGSTSKWFMVVDTAQNKIVGGVNWSIYQEDPFAEPMEQYEAKWHAEGGQREFATQAFWQIMLAREKYAKRPHISLEVIFTHPDYERQGVGRLSIEWGIKKAHELEMEMWVTSGRFAKPFYERFGFTAIEQFETRPVAKSTKPDEAWKSWEAEWATRPGWVMWRPKEGPFVEGKSVKTWTE